MHRLRVVLLACALLALVPSAAAAAGRSFTINRVVAPDRGAQIGTGLVKRGSPDVVSGSVLLPKGRWTVVTRVRSADGSEDITAQRSWRLTRARRVKAPLLDHDFARGTLIQASITVRRFVDARPIATGKTTFRV